MEKSTVFGACIENYKGIEYQYIFPKHGAYALMLRNGIDGLPQVAEVPPVVNVCFEKAGGRPAQVELAQVKRIAKEKKAEKKNPGWAYDPYINIDGIRYNPAYIVDCLEILGGNATFCHDPDSYLNGALMENENGRAILLPCRKP